MFQYSAGRALSLLLGQKLYLDVSAFEGYTLHQGYELDRVFNCTTPIAGEVEKRAVLGWQYSPIIQRIVARPFLSVFQRKGFIVEPHFHYWPGIKNISSDCYLRGYWQSEQYFQDVVPVIRSDFTFKKPLKGKNAELARQIMKVNAVSLHVRRGDYVSDPKTRVTLKLCSLDYYRSAIQFISDRVKEPYFFIFSDDISWVRNHLKVNFACSYVDNNHGAESYNDIHLMSLCRHHVIANSSFSWWGAWLNSYQDKIVVAPKKWFNNDNNTQDLFPAGWTLL